MKVIKKDITTIDRGVILHQVNCQNAMGSGVAKALYTKWNIVKTKYHEDMKKFNSPEEALGELIPVKINDKIVVFNSFTQLNFGNSKITKEVYTNMELLKDNIRKAYEFSKKYNQKLYLPEYVGCGLAGGDWSDLLEYLKSFDDNLIICSIS